MTAPTDGAPGAAGEVLATAWMVDCGDANVAEGDVRFWRAARKYEAHGCALAHGTKAVPLYTRPAPADGGALRDALAEVERLRAEMAIKAPPNLLSPEWGPDQFRRLFGEAYHPVKWGKHHATHDTTIDQALRIAGQRAPELADVIAALIWSNAITGHRAKWAFDLQTKAERERDAAESALAEARAVLARVEWAGGSLHGYACPICKGHKPGQDFDEAIPPTNIGHAPGCALAHRQSGLSLSESTAETVVSDNGLRPENSGESTAPTGPADAGGAERGVEGRDDGEG